MWYCIEQSKLHLIPDMTSEGSPVSLCAVSIGHFLPCKEKLREFSSQGTCIRNRVFFGFYLGLIIATKEYTFTSKQNVSRQQRERRGEGERERERRRGRGREIKDSRLCP